ncbi:hypothetical protein B0H13DRAFT_1862285 [Mycena leptocephala]|nr:hypothetical protein B0H13DRAFT_1862285 [Mycena leptocephala]
MTGFLTLSSAFGLDSDSSSDARISVSALNLSAIFDRQLVSRTRIHAKKRIRIAGIRARSIGIDTKTKYLFVTTRNHQYWYWNCRVTDFAVMQLSNLSASNKIAATCGVREAGPLFLPSPPLLSPPMLPPSLVSPLTQSPSTRRQRRQRRLNSASLMKALPGTILTTRDSMLSKCAATCHNAAGAAVCPDLATTCQCTNANFRSDFLSCVQGECQAAELDNPQQFVASLCGTVSLTAKPTATVPFLPTNANVDINEPSHTSPGIHAPAQTSQETGSPNTGSTQTVNRLLPRWMLKRKPKSLGQLWCRESRWMRPSQKGAPARTHNLRLINFSDVPAEENAAQASNAQDAANTEEAVTVRLRRVEAQLAALLTPAVESPEELPPKTVESIRSEDCERLSWVNHIRRMGSESPAWRENSHGSRNKNRKNKNRNPWIVNEKYETDHKQNGHTKDTR